MKTKSELGYQLAIAWLKHAYHPPALQKALGTLGRTPSNFNDPFISALMNMVHQGTHDKIDKKQDIDEFKKRVRVYFEETNLGKYFSTRVDYAAEKPLSDWADGLFFNMCFPGKYGVFLELESGEIGQCSFYMHEHEKLIYQPCEETIEEMEEKIGPQLMRAKNAIAKMPLSEEAKLKYQNMIDADLEEIKKDFELLKEYASLEVEGRERMTPIKIAELALERVKRYAKAESEQFPKLVQAILTLKENAEAKSMQDLESWASRATTIVSSYTNLPSTSFSDFKSEFSELFAEEAIQDLPSEEEGLIAKILQAFQELLYFGTNFQFFRPATLRADIYDVTQAKDILTEISLT